MFLRKLTVALCPPLLCLAVCLLYRWLDGVLGAGLFWSFCLKGLALGVAAALLLPVAGIKTYHNGLTSWLLAGAALLLALLLYQYLETVGSVHSQLLLTILTVNGQVVLVESTVLGCMVTTALLNRKGK